MDAKVAWHSLRNEVKQDSWSSKNYKVFLILISRLCQLEIEDELIPKLKGFARYSWVKNQIKVQVIARWIEQLQKSNIRFSFLNKIGLLLLLYQDNIKIIYLEGEIDMEVADKARQTILPLIESVFITLFILSFTSFKLSIYIIYI